jgi:type IV pilus biogenesis protein PilP
MRNNAITVALMLATFSLPSIVSAANQNLEDLSSVQADIILLQAKNDREELLQKLKKLQEPVVIKEQKETSAEATFSALIRPESPAPVPPAPVQPAFPPVVKEEKPVVKFEKAPEIPSLTGVVGAGTNLFATIAFESGQEIEASVGDPLPGGLTVVSLSLNKLILKDKTGKKYEVLKSTGSQKSTISTNTNTNTDTNTNTNTLENSPITLLPPNPKYPPLPQLPPSLQPQRGLNAMGGAQ